MLPLFPDSQHQMRVQGSVIKENIPDEKLSAAFWKFLIERAPFVHPPQPLTWFLSMMLFFAPSSLLAAIWHKEISGNQYIPGCQCGEVWPASGPLPDTPQCAAFQEAGEHEAEEKKPETSKGTKS